MATAMTNAQSGSGGSASRGNPGASQQASSLIDLLGNVPGTGDLVQQARALQADSQAQAQRNSMEPDNLTRGFNSGDRGFDSGNRGFDQGGFSQPGFGQNDQSRASMNNPAQNIDVQTIFKKIYPISKSLL